MGIAIPGSAKAKFKEGKGSERDVMGSNLMLASVRMMTVMTRKLRKKKKGMIVMVKTVMKIAGEYKI